MAQFAFGDVRRRVDHPQGATSSVFAEASLSSSKCCNIPLFQMVRVEDIPIPLPLVMLSFTFLDVSGVVADIAVA